MRRAAATVIAVLLGMGGACSTNTPETQTSAATEQPTKPAPGKQAIGGTAPVVVPKAEPPPPPPRTPLRLEPKAKVATSAGIPIELADLVIESIEPDPDDPNATGGDGVVATLQIGSDRVTLSELPEGYPSQRDVWTRTAHVQLAEMGGPPSPFVALHAERITDRVMAGSEREVVVELNQAAEIGPDTRITLLGHGHKTVSSRQKSPLIVTVEYTVGKGGSERMTYNLYPPDDARFTWRNYAFELEDHDYGKSMSLNVRRFELEPLVVGAE